jgi:dihydrofolate reductase
MGKIVAFVSVTLDGVMQAPGRPDEDTRGGFTHGGWATAYADPTPSESTKESMAASEALLLGHRTYDDFYSVWPHRTDNPFSAMLTNTLKYVPSRRSSVELPWENSTLVSGDVVGSLREIKQRHQKNIVILGSGNLIRSLLPDGLIDEIILGVHPLVLGAGQRLFDGPDERRFDLVSSEATSTGVVSATYRPSS